MTLYIVIGVSLALALYLAYYFLKPKRATVVTQPRAASTGNSGKQEKLIVIKPPSKKELAAMVAKQRAKEDMIWKEANNAVGNFFGD